MSMLDPWRNRGTRDPADIIEASQSRAIPGGDGVNGEAKFILAMLCLFFAGMSGEMSFLLALFLIPFM